MATLINPELLDCDVHVLSPRMVSRGKGAADVWGGQGSSSGLLQGAESLGLLSTVRGCAWGLLHALMC